MVFITFFLLLLYVVLLVVFAIGWKLMPSFEGFNRDTKKSLSVVIPCKNEAQNLPELIDALTKQSSKNIEYIFVNDHSEDATEMILDQSRLLFENCKVVQAQGCGKKGALKEGIRLASSDWVVTTDADCIPDIDWLATVQAAIGQFDADLFLLPVGQLDGNGLFYQLQKLEFVSLVASGAGASGAGMPILCNGANLAFKKELWLEAIPNLHDELISGDDIFLLEFAKRSGKKIRFLKSKKAFVRTRGATTLSFFIKQRQRWMSKAPAYKDLAMIYTACLIFFLNLSLLFSLFSLFFSGALWFWIVIAFFIKYLVDTSFLSLTARFFGLNHLLFYSLLLSITYPLYVVFTAVSGLWQKPKWK